VLESILINSQHYMCSAKGDSDCYAKRWLPLRLYEYFLTRLSALLFDRGCAVINLSKE